ncbi:MAG: glutamine synthetase III [Vicinamibacterales bacterium]
MRSTFEARGYTAWDPTSPPWLLMSGGTRHARHPDGVRELDR